MAVCECASWDEGRRLGFIRQIAGGFALIGWRGTERLQEPDPDGVPDQKVHEARFQWCPWCGGRARKPSSSFRGEVLNELVAALAGLAGEGS